MVSIKQVEAFYWTVQLGTLERAASKLYITQSAATKRLQELEKNSCLPIFKKSGQKTSITAKGEELFHLAETMLERLALLSKLRAPDQDVVRLLRIGVTELATLTWFSRFVRTMNAVYPMIAIQPDVDLSECLQRKLITGELDVIVVGADYLTPAMHSVALQSVPLTWIAPSTLPLPSSVLDVAALAQYPVIIQGPESAVTQRCELMFSEAGYEFTRVYGSSSIFALVSLVKAGIGISCVPEIVFEREAASGDLIALKTCPSPRPLEFHAAFLKVSKGLMGYVVADIVRKCIADGHTE